LYASSDVLWILNNVVEETSIYRSSERVMVHT